MPIETQSIDPEELEVAKSHLPFPVVGVGASAGGLAAMQRLFAGLREDCGMAFVVVMHLSPDHESSLGAILQRSTQLTVSTVSESTPIEVNHVYVVPPSKKLAMTDGKLRISDLATIEGRRQSIDLFFRSLAQAHMERSVCIVLSGTGSDGSQGLKRVKELGGVALAQSPEDAEFDGMPRAAIQTGQVDFAMPVSEMPEKLMLLWENAKRIELPDPPADLRVGRAAGEEEHLAEEALLSIKALLRERTGHDFAHYKRGTVLRRIERRMQVNALPDLPSYRRLLDTSPRETPALLQDMLISVTNFFRDRDAFDALGEALAKSVADRPAAEPFRAWVAGCATGEEAYSVAMLLHELLAERGGQVQIFASDIDQRAVAAARLGAYPASIVTDVSPERLTRFFTPEPEGYRIVKGVRDGVVFSMHNVLSDPPFTRMDLICCRNLLIYLDRAAQVQALRSFHFALKPGGMLFLGSSETVDLTDGIFSSVGKHKLYRAKPAVRKSLPSMPSRVPAAHAQALASEAGASAERPALETLHERVVRRHAAQTVLVDADDSVLHVSDRASHLLRLPMGAPTNKLMALARPELRAELRAAIAHALEVGRATEARPVRIVVNGHTRNVTMTVTPVSDEAPGGFLLVAFQESDESMAPDERAARERDPTLESTEAELIKTQERLRGMGAQSAASTEELRASNEELQTINEELRSTTEELETSREELQAVNEELTTVNAELNARVEETGKANDDLKNLMASADIGTVFVDRDMRVKLFTPQAAALFNLLPSDSGRPLLHIRHQLDYPQLEGDMERALRDLARVEREVRGEGGRWFLARAMPYRTAEDRIEGAVLAFVDITARRAAEEELRRSEQRMQMVADSMRDYAIVTMDARGTIVTWSAGAERIFGYAPDEVVGEPFGLIFTEEDRAAGVPAEELVEARERGRADDDRWHVSKDGRRIYCSGITTPLGDGINGYAKIARDFTSALLREKKRETALLDEQAERGRLQQASAMKDEFLALVSHELKNPLSVIQMNANLLTRLPEFRAAPRAERVAGAISSAVASQARIINDLLELSRVSTGKLNLAPTRVDLARLVREIAEAVEHDASAKRQRLSMEADATIWALVDPVRAEQIIWNLMINAVKFTPEGGAIEVRLTAQGAMALLTVSDNGIGIDPRKLADVFDMFKQVDMAPSRNNSGLGIGLALVRQLAELHGGRAEANSEGAGRGSVFSVWLPLAETLPTAAAAGYSAEGLAGMRILLVDDEPDLLFAFAELLRSEGADVSTADGATRALELVDSETFDAVISDISMPGRDGYWLAGELRRREALRGLPLLAVSGMVRDVDKAKALQAGFDTHLAKPLDFGTLRAAILAAATTHGGR